MWVSLHLHVCTHADESKPDVRSLTLATGAFSLCKHLVGYYSQPKLLLVQSTLPWVSLYL